MPRGTSGITVSGSPPICCAVCCRAGQADGKHVRLVFAGLGDGTVICLSCGADWARLAPAIEAKILEEGPTE